MEINIEMDAFHKDMIRRMALQHGVGKTSLPSPPGSFNYKSFGDAWYRVSDILEELEGNCNSTFTDSKLNQVVGILNLFTGKDISVIQIYNTIDIYSLYEIPYKIIKEGDKDIIYPLFLIDEKTGLPVKRT